MNGLGIQAGERGSKGLSTLSSLSFFPLTVSRILPLEVVLIIWKSECL